MSEEEIEIIPFGEQHLEAVLEVEEQSFTVPWSRAAYKHVLKDKYTVYIVALLRERVVGFAGIHCVLDEANLDNIAVHPDFRGRGIAKALLQKLIECGREQKLKYVTLEVRASNESAIGLYEEFDFYEVGRRKEYYKNPTEDAVLMDFNYKEEDILSKQANITREEAWELLKEYNKEDFHLRHGEVVEGIMRSFARELGYGEEEDYWGIVGLLHDLDFEMFPEEHCVKSQEIMEEKGVSEDIIRSTASHGYGMVSDIEPQHEMEKVLFAVDELSGLIGAVALVRPSKTVQDMELKSVKKKFKDKAFAAGCSRDVILKGAEMLGWELDDLIKRTIEAMKGDPKN